jgi:chromosomal replication initiation ATPase DnaA
MIAAIGYFKMKKNLFGKNFFNQFQDKNFVHFSQKFRNYDRLVIDRNFSQ